MEETQVVRALTALAHPLRLRVFRALVGAGGCGLVPSALSERLCVPPPTLSFHLKELVNSQLVNHERNGRFLIYRASLDSINAVLAYMTAHCCKGLPCVTDTNLTAIAAAETIKLRSKAAFLASR